VSSVFGAYARYYNLLYRDKSYVNEAQYVASRLSAATRDVHSILEFGCGTGSHAEFLARAGFSVKGIDLSPGMIEMAEARKAALPQDIGNRMSFAAGDARTARVGQTFDAVIALFHVINYQSTSADLAAAFETAASHLQSGGLFLFDFWYGPAVLTQLPEVRIRRLRDEQTAVLRLAEPTLDENANCVDVKFTVLVEDVASREREEIVEIHRMRYLFLPEIDVFLAQAGLVRIEAQEWMTGKPLSRDTWAGLVVARKIA
jgi:SAM-dependent methyltransferase